jgi:hypothetical protein
MIDQLTRTHRIPLLIVLGLLASLSWLPFQAEAGVDFCNSDPLIKIGSKMVSIKVGVDKNRLPDIDGTVHVVVHVPEGTPTNVVYVSQLYFPQAVRIQTIPGLTWDPNGRNTIQVKALVPGLGPNFATRLEVSSSGSPRSTTGKSDAWMSLSYTLR